jgi:hypothetical protein
LPGKNYNFHLEIGATVGFYANNPVGFTATAYPAARIESKSPPPLKAAPPKLEYILDSAGHNETILFSNFHTYAASQPLCNNLSTHP